MSPDDIFAANMWPWPDPLLKRDAMGRVVFVNAAFLQLYGGRVENWAGHPVQGWPAPNPQGLPYRFETRIGDGDGEIIYDWVEVTMSDGNALAIARDVTVFRKEPLVSEPVIEPQMAPPQAPDVTAPPTQQVPVAAPPAATPAFGSNEAATPMQVDVPNYDNAPMAQPPAAEIFVEPAPQTLETLAPEAQIAAPLPTPPLAPIFETKAPPEPEIVESPEDTPATPIDAAPEVQAAPEPVASAPEIQAAPSQPPAEAAAAPEAPAASQPSRDFERRALPIEDGDSVLGSNWRDAVIAKAVGADLTPQAEPEPETTPAPVQAEQDGPVGAGLRILLAEDNAINALLTRTLLEAEGCVVETVEDGQLAVQAMTNNMYDLIFMDMRMPNMDGLEATRKIRAMGPRTADLPIIALTANAFDDDRNACFDSGMNDFMTKPVSAEELTAMVETWTKKKAEKEAAA